MNLEDKVATEDLKSFSYFILSIGVFSFVIGFILMVIKWVFGVKFDDFFVNIPVTFGISIIAIALVGFYFETQGWLQIITKSIRDLMLKPEFLVNLGMRSDAIRHHCLNILKSGLSIDALDECYFNDLDSVVLSNLLEPIHEDEIHNFKLSIAEKDGKPVIHINHYNKFRVVNPTKDEQSLLRDDIVVQYGTTDLEGFPEMTEEDAKDAIKINFFKLDNEDHKDEIKKFSDEVPEKISEEHWKITKKYVAKLAPHSSKHPEKSSTLVEIDQSMFADFADVITWGIKRITRKLTVIVEYPDEIEVFPSLVPPTAYPVVKTPDISKDREKLIWYEDILYPGNAIVVFWRPKKGENNASPRIEKEDEQPDEG